MRSLEKPVQLASLLQQHDFDFETTQMLTKAFDEVWGLMMEAGGPLIADYQAPATRLLLAQYLVDRAMQGERDVERMPINMHNMARAGFDHILTKPFKVAEFVDMLRGTRGRRPGRRARRRMARPLRERQLERRARQTREQHHCRSVRSPWRLLQQASPGLLTSLPCL